MGFPIKVNHSGNRGNMGRIEKGCIALIIKSRAGNVGKIVNVIQFIGEHYFDNILENDCWEVYPHLKGTNGKIDGFICESQLQRIDAPIKEKEKEKEKQK